MKLTRLSLSQCCALIAFATLPCAGQAQAVWSGYAGDAQHTALSSIASQPLNMIVWQTPMDLSPVYSGNDLLIHYGSALVTQANTIVVPVKTGAFDGFKVEGRSGANGNLLWTLNTDYLAPQPWPQWVPSYAPALSSGNRLYFAGAGGTVYFKDTPDQATGSTGQLAFFGLANYQASAAAYNSSVFINTPITSDNAGNVYFGFQTLGNSPLGATGGVAKIDASGVGTWVGASSLVGGMTKTAINAAPAISNDGTKVYFALSNGGDGRLVQLKTSDLSLVSASAPLQAVEDVSTASPTIGPDGDVYFGTNNGYHFRGVMNHFSADLSVVKTPASFGWDDTASIVPRSMVPSYTGTSNYLLMIKYNDYAGVGGTGINKVAIVDPNDLTQIDPVTGQTVMKEILTIAGVTPDGNPPVLPGAVREWCINTAVVDPATGSILVNSEDGKLYRWNLTSNTFTEVITLTSGIGEAYTPTMIGADGKVYAINNATLFAVGVPEPASWAYALAGLATIAFLVRRRAVH